MRARPQVADRGAPRAFVRERPKIIVRTDREEIRSSEEIKNIIKGTIDPAKTKIKIDKMIRGLDKKIIIEAPEESVKKIMENEEVKAADLKRVKEEGLRPRLVIMRVSKGTTASELKEAILKQNLTEHSISEDEIGVKYKYGPRDQATVNWVLEVSPRVRNLALNRGRVYIGWDSCPVRDHIRVIRCYRCQKYGHLAKNCRSEKEFCAYCAGEHQTKECREPEEYKCCINCIRGKIRDRELLRHEATESKCPEYVRKVTDLVNNIDYGK